MNLFYTVSTPDEDALLCADLARKSVLSAIPGVDFIIVGRKEERSKYPKELNVLFCEDLVNCWVGNLRYSQSIFKMNYDTFTYIDSDILWFAKNFDFSQNMFCRESVCVSNPWFSFEWGIPIPNGIEGVNSGFFSMNKKTAFELSDFFVRHISNKKTNLMVDHIKLEQSTFNLYLFKHGYQGWEDKSNSFQFTCDEKTKFLPNKNFHFNKHQLKMNLKFKMMESFLKINSLYSKLDYRQ